MEVRLWIELKDKDEKNFIDKLEELCERYSDGKKYYFTFKA